MGTRVIFVFLLDPHAILARQPRAHEARQENDFVLDFSIGISDVSPIADVSCDTGTSVFIYVSCA